MGQGWADGACYALRGTSDHPVAPCQAVYSLVLASGHTVMIGGFECVTLGHGLEGAVVGHAYLGTAKVVEDLERFEGWQRGLVEFFDGCMLRDRATGIMCAWD